MGYPFKLTFCLFLLQLSLKSFSQYKSYDITVDGDTIDIIDAAGLKQGSWIESKAAMRGEPGCEEEGTYKDGMREGFWRRYSLQGDLLAVENYSRGGKSGLQRYYSFLGGLEREENWRAYNPDAPYDTIPVYGAGNDDVLEFKVVKAEQYSVKDGVWRYYDPETGRLVRSEEWDRNRLMTPQEDYSRAGKYEKPKKVDKTPEMLEWERKNAGKKRVLRDGATGL
jgi:hypothetical protein